MEIKNVLSCSANDVAEFFMQSSSYCSIELPKYFNFTKLLASINSILCETNFSDNIIEEKEKYVNIGNYTDVNYKIFANKDGKYSWRPLEIINPVLYVNLVKIITDKKNWKKIKKRFTQFQQNKKIRCVSIPVISSKDDQKAKQILSWWELFEQKSIEQSLDYSYMYETDITDCYGSIYTHAVAWAIETKDSAKEKRNDKELLGNKIDYCIQGMRNGQTNGIPQGSVLMDFIAEIILGYVDLELSGKIKEVEDFHILRYRDDYRIFTNNPQDGEKIIKHLTDTLSSLGMRLNASKTKSQSDIITHSIKADKLAWINKTCSAESLQKKLYFIHSHATEYTNSGSLIRALNDFDKSLDAEEKNDNQLIPMIAIIVDIAYKNPRAYAVCTAILSKLLNTVSPQEKKEVIEKILKRFSNIPNTGYLEIWLQRFTLGFDKEKCYNEHLCKLVKKEYVELWNFKWIKEESEFHTIVKDVSQIIDEKEIKELKPIIKSSEVDIFSDY